MTSRKILKHSSESVLRQSSKANSDICNNNAKSRDGDEIVQIESSSSCYTTLAMADRVKSLEVSLASLQKQARQMVANSGTITAEIQQRAVAAVNVKDALFENLIPIEVELSKKTSRQRARSTSKLDFAKGEEDDLENIPIDIREARLKMLSLKEPTINGRSSSWLYDSFQHIPAVENFELSIDDCWNVLSVNIDQV